MFLFCCRIVVFSVSPDSSITSLNSWPSFHHPSASSAALLSGVFPLLSHMLTYLLPRSTAFKQTCRGNDRIIAGMLQELGHFLQLLEIFSLHITFLLSWLQIQMNNIKNLGKTEPKANYSFFSFFFFFSQIYTDNAI